MGIEFNSTASQDQIPKPDAVAQTLISAASNSSNSFNISIDSSSVKVVGKKIQAATWMHNLYIAYDYHPVFE